MDPESLERDNERGLDLLSERIGLLKSVLSPAKSVNISEQWAKLTQRFGNYAGYSWHQK
jgi:hypothetical protein